MINNQITRLELKSQHDQLDSIALRNKITRNNNNNNDNLIDEIDESIGSIKTKMQANDNDNDEFEDSDDEIEPHFNEYRHTDNKLIRNSPLGNDRRLSLKDGLHGQQPQRNSQNFKSPQSNRFQQKQNDYHRQSMYIPSNRTSINGSGRTMSLRSVPTGSLQFHDIQTNNFTNNVNHTSTMNNSMLDYSRPTRYSFNNGNGNVNIRNGNGNGDMGDIGDTYLSHSPSISENYYEDVGNDFINDDIIDTVQLNDVYHGDEGTDTIHQRSPMLSQHSQMRSPGNQYRQQQQQQQQQQQYFDSNQLSDRDTRNFRNPSLMSMSTISGSTRYGVSSHLRPIDDKYYSNNTNTNNNRYDSVQSRNATSRLSNISRLSNNSRFGGYNHSDTYDDIEDDRQYNNQQYQQYNNSANNRNPNMAGIRSRPLSHLGTYSNFNPHETNGNETSNNGNNGFINNRTRNTSSNNAYKRQSVRF
ncbi:unnamed protein product [[Candida] boidinii]|nr:unnamed protein product [[Candida] boidinii]